MRPVILIALACLPICVPASAVADDNQLIGQWKVVATSLYGKVTDVKKETIWEFTKDARLLMPGTNRLDGKYKLDDSTSPWSIDIELAGDRKALGGGGPRKGIVKIKDGVMTLCVVGGAFLDRPAKFKSEKKTLTILYKMKLVVPDK